MMEIFKRFTFDAAHQLACNVPAGHRYAGLHGHSFEVEVFVGGEPDPAKGWVVDFAALEAALKPLQETLDHGYLNEIPGLEVPTLEHIAIWIWDRLKPQFPGLARVVVKRGSFGEGCVYSGPRG
ncbi:6-pyruvoyl trahydropterin synthase family protein [Govanella unica]|nr:6-carboxytetrahydropterin synthase [Govania unica]